jgi:hypothetical protein
MTLRIYATDEDSTDEDTLSLDSLWMVSGDDKPLGLWITSLAVLLGLCRRLLRMVHRVR